LGNHGCNGTFVSHFWEESKRFAHKQLKRQIMKDSFNFIVSGVEKNKRVVGSGDV
jgi:hypothetical protein